MARGSKWCNGSKLLNHYVNYAEKAASVFADIEDPNTLEAKKEIFATLGSDLILKDKMLSFEWDKLLFPIKSMAKEVREIKERLEPAKKPVTTKDMEEIYSQNLDTNSFFEDESVRLPSPAIGGAG